jgi:hypothetical protein
MTKILQMKSTQSAKHATSQILVLTPSEGQHKNEMSHPESLNFKGIFKKRCHMLSKSKTEAEIVYFSSTRNPKYY